MAQRLIVQGDDMYPAGLGDLERPPPVYVAGELTQEPGVAVVGTRRCTRYGSELARSFGQALADADWTTVSGLARGIDAAAHWGALDVGGNAVGVLGTGLDVWYPADNHSLYRAILDSAGALVTEYPPGTGPERWRFPERNRLIAAMASAVVVVEAGEKGGALITARLAAEIGRPVFVVPGDVDRPASIGCNRLIKDGAHPVLGPDDLIAELGLLLGPPRKGHAGRAEPVDISDLAGHWGCSETEALVRLGRLEAQGKARREGEAVYLD